MLNRILVPLDGSALAEQALAYAAELSRPTGATLLLVRAAYAHTLPGVDPRERKAGAIDEAEEYLSATAAALGERGYACETLVPFGHSAECITEEARLHNADLVVMTTHGRSGPGRLVFGSVAESVVARSSVPVLVARAWLPPQRQPFLPAQPLFVVPLDGSPFAEAALGPAISFADDFGAGLVLMRAEAETGPVDEALDYLTGVQAQLARQYPELSVLTDVRTADPAHAIHDGLLQTGASLVVMATHGRGGVVRSVTGSVAGQVLKTGTAPLMLVRPTPFLADVEEASSLVVAVEV
ncbi:MAG TPA: universal stress protein [Chloroflexota bacterium]